MQKSEKVLILSNIVLVGFVFGIIYHYVLGFYLNLGTHFNSFLYPASAAFCDFWGPFPYLHKFAPYSEVNLWIVYFPLAYILMTPFAFISNAVVSYLLYISGFLAYFIFMNVKTFSCPNFNKLQNFQNIFIITAMSYPVLYILDKGNFDMFLFVILGLFAYFFKAEKYFIAAILLAIETAIKPFTFLFFILFLFKKRFKEFFLAVLLTVLLIIGSFFFFKGGFADQFVNLIKILALYKNTFTYALDNNFGISYGSSLFMVLKLFFCKLTATPIISPVLLTKIYDVICTILTVFTVFFVYREKTYWKQLALLIFNFLLLPYNTYDYKLIFLFIPLWLFVTSKEKTRFDLAYSILFALLLIPKHIIIINHIISPTATKWFSLSIIFNPLIMIILSCLIIFEQFYNKKKVTSDDI